LEGKAKRLERGGEKLQRKKRTKKRGERNGDFCRANKRVVEVGNKKRGKGKVGVPCDLT